MTAEREEVVVDADPRQAEHLGEQRAQQLLLRGAWRAIRVGGVTSGAGRALRSSLPLAVSGSLSSNTKSQAPYNPAGLRRDARAVTRDQRSGLRRGPHSHQLLVTRRILARDDDGLRHVGMTLQRARSRRARCGSHAASLGIRAPEKSSTPSARQRARSPVRYAAAAGPNGRHDRSAVSSRDRIAARQTRSAM
jgi:hypothetical protein